MCRIRILVVNRCIQYVFTIVYRVNSIQPSITIIQPATMNRPDFVLRLTIILIVIVIGCKVLSIYILIVPTQIIRLIIVEFLPAGSTSTLDDFRLTPGKVIQITLRDVVSLIRYTSQIILIVISVRYYMRIILIILFRQYSSMTVITIILTATIRIKVNGK